MSVMFSVDDYVEQQAQRTKKKAEVFAPAWLCNCMSNHCDTEWFGREGVFNTELDHTERELAIMKEYEAAVDSDVKTFVEDAVTGTGKLNYVTVAFLTSKAAERIKELTGKNVLGNRVVLDINAVKHIENRHGVNGKQDHSMSDMNDIARIGYVISNFDEITWDGEISFNHIDENGNPAPMVQFSKRIDGTIYVVQTVSEVKSKRNYIVTAYIKKKQPSNP